MSSTPAAQSVISYAIYAQGVGQPISAFAIPPGGAAPAGYKFVTTNEPPQSAGAMYVLGQDQKSWRLRTEAEKVRDRREQIYALLRSELNHQLTEGWFAVSFETQPSGTFYYQGAAAAALANVAWSSKLSVTMPRCTQANDTALTVVTHAHTRADAAQVLKAYAVRMSGLWAQMQPWLSAVKTATTTQAVDGCALPNFFTSAGRSLPPVTN